MNLNKHYERNQKIQIFFFLPDIQNGKWFKVVLQ